MKTPDITSPRFKADPHPFYSWLRAESPVLRIRWLMGMPVWLVARYDDALVVLKDPRFSKEYTSKIPFVPKPVRHLTKNLLNADAPAHTRLRALINKAFTPAVVERLRGQVEHYCDDLLDRAAVRGSMDLVSEYALPVPLNVIADLLGIPEENRARFAKWSKRIAAGDSGRLFAALVGFFYMWRFDRYFRTLIAARRNDDRDDIISALIRAEEAGDKLSEHELLSMIGLLLFAGYETSVNLISSGALLLMQHPEQRDRFIQDPSVRASAVDELLRYSSPADFATPRIAREDITLSGVRIPRGAMVLAALGSANRDEKYFADPHTLDITRQPNRHLGFGIGAHFCVGASLARLEVEIALTKLFQRFPGIRVKDRADNLQWRSGMLFRGLERLDVEVRT